MEEIIFPNQIRTYRRRAGYTMQELADFLKMSLSAISKIEKGYRRINQDQMIAVADFLDCPIGDIFVTDNNANPEVIEQWKMEQDRRNTINANSGLKTLGAGLRYIRNQKNLTLSDVADGAEMTLSVYHRIEMGQREVSEDEFNRIARVLAFSTEDLQKQIYQLEKSGKLKDYIQFSENKYKAGPKGGLPDAGKMAAMTGKGETAIPVFGETGENGTIHLEKETPLSTLGISSNLGLSSSAYGLNLATRRIPSILSSRAVLVIDPKKMAGSGDMAVIVKGNDARLVSVRQDGKGKFTGILWNPDEEISISEKQMSELQKVVAIILP